MKHVQIEVTYDRYSAVRTSSHCMCTCNPFLPHSKYRHYCKDWAYSCPWLQRNKKSHSSTCTLFIPQFQCYVLCYIYFNSILTDLPTEIRKTSAMMKPAKDNRNVLLLFHIIGVIKKINQSTDSLILLELISMIYFCRKITSLFTSSIVIVLYYAQVTIKAHEPNVCNFVGLVCL